MTLQQLEYIVAVDKYRHFVKAAESCKVTQSTLSALIQKLEQELDVVIFDRKSHPIKPTALGEAVIKQAKIVLFNASQLQEFVLSEKEKERGEIRMGIASTVAPYVLPKLFKLFTAQHPLIKLTVEESRMATIMQKLERAELDVALMATPLENPQLLEIPLYKERLVAYVSRADELFNQQELDVNNLPADNLWVLQEGYCPKGGFFSFCNRRSGKASIYEAGSIETLVKIVDECGGYTIIPELHVPLLRNCQQGQIRQLKNPEPSREVALIIRHDYVHQRLLNILADCIKQVIPSSMLNERVKKFSIVI